MKRSKVLLGVNIDHIAQVRQARLGTEPDPLVFARLAEKSGADGITVHLREDRRHIQDKDVLNLRKRIRARLNLEMAGTDAMVSFACRVKPEEVCLVPEKREELTTEGGLDVLRNREKIRAFVSRLKKSGICVSIFVDPLQGQILASQEVGADCVELHTGAYAGAQSNLQKKLKYRKLVLAGQCALKAGLILNAGHGLDYRNVVPVSRMTGMHELNIGYSIVVRALTVGFEKAVQEMKSLI
ncbi:MAG: pyridoxine 5'-phosphate synthase [Elusimicrobia bacterium]|nr:pyridoxine 5'-phosphate synthase [Elusimicrobiota bacterium]